MREFPIIETSLRDIDTRNALITHIARCCLFLPRNEFSYLLVKWLVSIGVDFCLYLFNFFINRATLPLSMNDLISQDCACSHMSSNNISKASGSNYGNNVENLSLYDNHRHSEQRVSESSKP